MKKKTVMLAAGGTGGHLFPASALARSLAQKDINVFLLTDARGARFIDKLDNPIPYAVIKADTIRAGLFGKFRSAVTIGWGYLKSFWLIMRQKPSAMIGFGGYPSFPPVLAAAHQKVPVILHEQNAVLGKANRALAKYAQHIALSFEKVDRLSPNLTSKVTVTGNPVRHDIIRKSETPYLSPRMDGPFRLVVVGGSQGAQVFSEIVPKAIKLLPENIQKNMHIVQQCREEDIEQARKLYASCTVSHLRLEAFINDIPDVLAQSHLVITRAGASTVAELTAIGRPAIFVPLPGSLEGDQAENAAGIADQGGGWVMPQDSLTPETLSQQLEIFLLFPEKLTVAAKAMKSLGTPNAVEKLSQLVIVTAEATK